MLERIHVNQLGIDKCNNRARECLFWPGINNEIANQSAIFVQNTEDLILKRVLFLTQFQKMFGRRNPIKQIEPIEPIADQHHNEDAEEKLIKEFEHKLSIDNKPSTTRSGRRVFPPTKFWLGEKPKHK
ncbi:hypothetical protein CBL_20683 [Carabus blaptoides fortunei]